MTSSIDREEPPPLKLFVSTHVLSYRFSRGALGARFNGCPCFYSPRSAAKSGKPQTVPVVYMKDEDRFIISPRAGPLAQDGASTSRTNPTRRFKSDRERSGSRQRSRPDRKGSTLDHGSSVLETSTRRHIPGPIPLLVLWPIP